MSRARARGTWTSAPAAYHRASEPLLTRPQWKTRTGHSLNRTCQAAHQGRVTNGTRGRHCRKSSGEGAVVLGEPSLHFPWVRCRKFRGQTSSQGG